MDPIKSDRIVSLIEQFASLFCQRCAPAKIPRVPCAEAAEPSPQLPSSFIITAACTCTRASHRSHAAVYGDGCSAAERGVGSAQGHLATWVLLAVCVSLC